MAVVSSGNWKFDEKFKSSTIEIVDSKKLHIKKITTTGHEGACADRKLSGIVKWKVKFTLAGNQWMVFGILDKKEHASMEGWDYNVKCKNCWGIDAYNAPNRMTLSNGTFPSVSGECNYTCVYDGYKGTFSIEASNGAKVTCDGLKGKDLYAFVSLYSVGNEAVVSFDK